MRPVKAPWRSWLARRPVTAEVAGSSPVGVAERTYRSGPGSSAGSSVRLKSERSPVRPRSWPPPKTPRRDPGRLCVATVVPGRLQPLGDEGRDTRFVLDDQNLAHAIASRLVGVGAAACSGSTSATVLPSPGVDSMSTRHRPAHRRDREVDLSAREFTLAEAFLANPGQVLSREQLLSSVWGYDFDPGSNVVDVYVR